MCVYMYIYIYMHMSTMMISLLTMNVSRDDGIHGHEDKDAGGEGLPYRC